MSTGRTEDVIWLRPEQASVGRPAERSRAEITAAAVALADREGLDAVSMRRLAGELGTGAASLYRYLATRDDLLDLMTDATGAEYALAPPSGDWLADLVAVGRQARAIMRRHPWLPALVATRPTLGPNGAALLEHVLAVLADHPAAAATKLEAFAMLNAVTTALVQHELGGGEEARRRQAGYLWHLAQQGEHPHLAELLGRLAPAPPGADDTADDILARVLSGILAAGPA